MNINPMNFLLYLSSISLGIFLIIYIYFKYSYTYWKKKGIVYLEPSFPFGNFTDAILQKKSSGLLLQDVYNKLEGCDIGGLYAFRRPVLVIRNPDIIKTLLVKDFVHFQDHGIYFHEESDPLMANLFVLSGPKWRNLRIKLSPAFSLGKLKMMFQILADCGNELQEHVHNSALKGEALDIKDVTARYSTDIIASYAFGIQCNCLKDPNAEFRQWGRKIFQTSIKTGIRDVAMFVAPSIAAVLKIPFVPPDITSYFDKMVRETVEYRETNNVTRNDFMQLLIELKNKGEIGVDDSYKKQENDVSSPGTDNITMRDVAAQAYVFFVAGFETSSTTMSLCLYELALNPDVQKRVQDEIDDVLKRHGNKISYDAVQEMEYLDRAVAETLRLYPPVPFLTRVCTKEYTLQETNTFIEKGTSIMIPVLGLQRDPKYFPNPDVFDPDRFVERVKNRRHQFTYLPFGEGPRICIGMKFGLLQTKVGLASLLSKNSFEMCDKTPVPLKIDPKTFVTSPAGGIWLKIVKRS